MNSSAKFEMGVMWLEGCNTSLEPEAIGMKQYAWGVNIDNTKGVIYTRPGYTQISTLPAGKIQMLAHFQDNLGLDWLVTGIAGRLYASPQVNDGIGAVYLDLGVSLNATVDFFTHEVVQVGACRNRDGAVAGGTTDANRVGERYKKATRNYLIVSDLGTNFPVRFDGVSTVQDATDFGIPKCSWMCFVKNRLWVWDISNKSLKWSDIDDPLTFYDVGFLANGGSFALLSECTGLARHPDFKGSFLAFEKERTWLFSTEYPIKVEGDWKSIPHFQRQLFPHLGCVAGKSFVHHYGDLWWWSNKGLMSIRRGMESLVGDEIGMTDLEMTRSLNEFPLVSNDVVGTSHEDFLLMVVPTGDIWVKNNCPASYINGNTKPAWVGVWNGLKPQVIETYTDEVTGQVKTFVVSSDADGTNRLWQLFNGTHQDNGGAIKCSIETRAAAFENLFLDKRFGYFDFRAIDIWGDVSVTGYYKGTRGAWKQLLSKQIKAAKTIDSNGSQITQFRRIRSQEAQGSLQACDSVLTESNFNDDVDGAFQIMIQWQGQMAVAAYQMAALLDTPDFTGRLEQDETVAAVKTLCGNPQSVAYTPPYIEHVHVSVSITIAGDVPVSYTGFYSCPATT